MTGKKRGHWQWKRLQSILLAAVLVAQLLAGGAAALAAEAGEEPDNGQEIVLRTPEDSTLGDIDPSAPEAGENAGNDDIDDVDIDDDGPEDEPEDEPDEAVPPAKAAPQSQNDGNLVEDGNFSQGGKGWTPLGTWTFGENGASTTTTGAGADWSTMLKYTVQLEAGYEYAVSVTLISTVERTIILDMGDMDPREFTSDTIPANQETTVTYTSERGIGGDRVLGIYLGGTDYGEHTVTITNVSVVRGNKIKLPGEDTDPGEAVEPLPGNVLDNGNFAKQGDGWDKYAANADIYFNDYRTVLYLKAKAGADYEQGLKHPLILESGTKYDVTFTVRASVDRTISVNLKDVATGDIFTSNIIPADMDTEIHFVTDGWTNRDPNTFFLFLGGADVEYPHSVVISNINIVPQPLELEDAKNDEEPAPIDSIKDTVAAEQTILKDGNFTQGMTMWEHWEEEWMVTWDVVKYTPVEDGVQVYITNVGNGEKNFPWDVQLNQHIDLKTGLNYTLSFDVFTEKARAFNVVINDPSDKNIFSKTVGLQAGESRHVVFNIPAQETDAIHYLFSLQLGSNNHTEVRENTLTFKNMKIEVNGYSERAVRIDDGDFTDGFGSFTSSGDIKAEDGSVTATGGTLTRPITGMESGVAYILSFMAGSVDEGNITVALPNGESKTFDLTDDAKLCTVDFTANSETGDLTFDFGTDSSIICLDTVRLDAAGYVEAAGVNVEKHDITRLTKNQAPLLSEMALAEFGKDVVLTFAHDEKYEEAISSITMDGRTLSEGDYTVGSGTITLKSELFTNTFGGDRQTYNIVVSAYWYTDNRAIQIVYEPGVFTATWSDEFNDTKLDESKWGYQDGTGAEYGLDGWGNNEQQYYTRDNLTVGDGAMTITATKGTHSKKYDSARIWTRNQAGTETCFSQTYGRFEAKMKLPAGEGCDGLWPAFWLLPVDTGIYGGWPVSGEIDIMEARGRDGSTMDGTLHYGRPWPNEGGDGGHAHWDDPLAIAEYHIYSVDWTPTYMSFQVDGEEYWRAENWWSQQDGQPAPFAFPAPFDQDFYIIFNLAVGGNYDGGLEPSKDVLPAEMKVDYVRVYQFNGLPDDTIVNDPKVEAEPIPAGAKSSIIDPDFTDVKKVVNDGDPKNIDGWNLLALSQFGGAADFSTVDVDGTTFAKVNITNGGSANYSVQLTQKLELYYGNWYTLSFDAYADSPREIIAKIGGDGTNNGNWGTYHSETTALGREIRHYEYTFQMLSSSDPFSRLELNMGFGTGPVYIANVKFMGADGLSLDHDMAKAPLENGEGIYNGAFNLGTADRLAYWHAGGGAVAKDTAKSEYWFQAGTGGATLYQTGIELLQNDTYRLTANVKGSVSYTITASSGTVIKTGTLSGTDEFTVPAGVTDKNATVTFTLAAYATLDNISLVRTTFNNVDYSGLDCYPLVNGDFENGEMGWGTYGTKLTVTEETDGNHIGKVTSGGANRWDALLSQDLHLLGGYTYELSFKARADKVAVIDLSMEDANYSRAFEQTNIKVGTEWTNYNYTFKFNADKDLSLKFLVGGGNFTLSLDDVEVKIKGAPVNPGTFVTDGYYKAAEAVAVTHTGSTEWQNAAELTLNGKKLAASDYSWDNGKLTLNGSLFPESGEYTLAATAEGYADTKAAVIRVYPANGDLIYNGGFDHGGDTWETYIHNGNCAELDFTAGYLDVRYEHVEADPYGYIPWAIQTNQWFTAPKSGTYTLHFMASSEVDRYILVGVKDVVTKVVELTGNWMDHALDVTIPAPGTYQLQFFMGATNPNTDNGYFTNDSEDKANFVDFGPHNFYLDNISLIPEGSEYTAETVPTSIKLTGEESVTVGDTATITAVLNHPVNGGNKPTGSVAFTMNGNSVTAANGVLKLDTSTAGTYTIKASYAGDESFGSSEAEFTVTVREAGAPDTPENPDTPSDPGTSSNPGSGNSGRPSRPDTDIDEPQVPLTQPFVFADVAAGSWYYDAVKYVFDKGLMAGVSDTSFAPGDVTTRGMVVTILHRMEKEPAAAVSSFLDRADGQWYTDAIDWAAETGVVSGYDNGHFGANDNVTREQLVTILYRYAGMKNCDVSAHTDLGSYSDAAQVSGYAREAMSWAVASGLVQGTSSATISPRDTATRAQVALILMRFCENVAVKDTIA